MQSWDLLLLQAVVPVASLPMISINNVDGNCKCSSSNSCKTSSNSSDSNDNNDSNKH
ncbi:hypothetical protein CPC16_004649, partial [Podila verticillata]